MAEQSAQDARIKELEELLKKANDKIEKQSRPASMNVSSAVSGVLSKLNAGRGYNSTSFLESYCFLIVYLLGDKTTNRESAFAKIRLSSSDVQVRVFGSLDSNRFDLTILFVGA